MRRQRWWLPLVAIAFMTNWKSTLTLPVPDEELDTSTKLLGSSVVTSVSVVTGLPENGTPGIDVASTADRKRVIPSKELPGSPAGLLRPDRFQFYTLNQEGNVVTKQMTEQEIQTLIAAGGGHLPMEIHEPQQVGDVPTGGMKVADVVQNVQNVLKGELNKPPTVMTSVPTIPGHVNTEWSSILPAILGGESETVPVNEPGPSISSDISNIPIVTDTTVIKVPEPAVLQTIATKMPTKEPVTVAPVVDYDTKKKPAIILETESHPEKPMIQVPVITVDQKLPAHQPEEDSTPVFQMLNTISADKINMKNHSDFGDKPQYVKPEQIDVPDDENVSSKPQKVAIKPTILPALADDQFVHPVNTVPEMIPVNFDPDVKKPLVKPEAAILISESFAKLPESEPASTMSVISETHTTSTKISSQEKIPERKPTEPAIEIADRVQPTTEATEKSTLTSSPDAELDSTTIKVEATVTTERAATETSTKPGLLAQGVSFFGNLPETVSSIVSEFISTNTPSATPIIAEANKKTPVESSENIEKPLETINSDKNPATSKYPAVSTTMVLPEEEAVTKSSVVHQEPVYQIMPEITPDKKTPHGTSQSEASSIEHIIETLNDPTGSISGTVAADHFIVQPIPAESINITKIQEIQPEPQNLTNLPEFQAPTAATPSNVETPVEISSSKPMEPLPTELADSLSSMISQISDAMPSVLPVSQNTGLDTTEKKNVANVNAEESSATEAIQTTELPEVTKLFDDSTSTVQLTVPAETEKPVLPNRIPENPMSDISNVPESIEKLEENVSMTDIPATTELSNFDGTSTVKSDVSQTNNEELEALASKVNLTIPENLEAADSVKPEKLKPEIDVAQEPSDITTDKLAPEDVTAEKIMPNDVTPSATVETDSTGISTVVPSESTAAPELSHHTKIPATLHTDVLPAVMEETTTKQDQQKDSTVKVELNENNTELPIVRIDITEAKPTQFSNTKNPQENENLENGTESPFVRIQLTDPVTLVNNMIQSANVDVPITPVASLNLPKIENVSPNSVASGLIAGFPSSTTPSTKIVELAPEPSVTTLDSVTSQPEVHLVNDAPIVTTPIELETSDPHVENETKTVTELLGTKKDSNLTEAIEVTEDSTSKDDLIVTPKIPVEKIDLPKESITTETPEKSTATEVNLLNLTSTDEIKDEEIQEAVTVANTEAPVENSTPLIKLDEPVNAYETTTKISAMPAEVTDNAIKLSTSPIPEISDSGEKVKEASKIIETVISTSAQPEISAQEPESTILNIQVSTPMIPEKSAESTNFTKQETPIIRLDVDNESALEDIPSKIQLTDLPIVETTITSKTPLKEEEIQIINDTQSSQSITTMQAPIMVSTENQNDASSNVELQVTTVRTKIVAEEITPELTSNETLTENPSKNPEKIDKIEELNVSKNNTENSSPIVIPPKTEEVRIQVNDTAVLVTKRPVSEGPGQKLGDVNKLPLSPVVSEESTTPKTAETTSVSYGNLSEEVEQLSSTTNSSKLSSSHIANATDLEIKKDVISESETETRVRLGDEQNDKGNAEVKVDDPRKPIKKTSDNDPLQSVEKKDVPISSTTKNPANINDDVSLAKKNDSNAQASIKVEISTIPSVIKSSIPPKISSKPEQKPLKINEKEGPAKVTHRPKPGKPAHKPMMNIKKDDAVPRPPEEKWTLIPQQVYPALTKTGAQHSSRPNTPETTSANLDQNDPKIAERPPVPLDHSQSASGLDSTVKNLETDIAYFANLCNELAFTLWTATNKGLSTARSLAVSPFGMTSMLAMVFLGARGPTSDQMNDVLKLDDVASFNPHLVFQNVTDAVGLARNQGIANAAFVRELFADRSKVRKLMPFYKDQAQQFYDGIVAEVNFATISDLVRRRTNLMIRKQTGGRIKDFVRTNTVPLRSPLAAISANVFQTDCNSSAASSEGRDGELYFAVSPAVRQRKLVPVPATVWRAGVLAGYEPSIDATAIALGGIDKLVSTIFVIPGQQGHSALGDTLDRLEQRVIRGATHDGSWNKLLKVLIPRPGLELQVPKFSHRSVINATAALKRMGLEELFSKHADLKGINGVATDLHLADVLQMNLFSTCGDENIISGRHHVEVYPGSPLRNARVEQSADFEDDFEDDADIFSDNSTNEEDVISDSTNTHDDVLHRESRSARQTDTAEKPRLKLDRPFLYFVRHNPTGLILHMGRFNPRLLP